MCWHQGARAEPLAWPSKPRSHLPGSSLAFRRAKASLSLYFSLSLFLSVLSIRTFISEMVIAQLAGFSYFSWSCLQAF